MSPGAFIFLILIFLLFILLVIKIDGPEPVSEPPKKLHEDSRLTIKIAAKGPLLLTVKNDLPETMDTIFWRLDFSKIEESDSGKSDQSTKQ